MSTRHIFFQKYRINVYTYKMIRNRDVLELNLIALANDHVDQRFLNVDN